MQNIFKNNFIQFILSLTLRKKKSIMDWWQIVLGLIVASFTIVGSVFTAIWFVFRKVADLQECLKRIGNIENKIDSLDSIISSQGDRILVIETAMSLKVKGVENLLSQRHSPRVLNTLGEMLFNEMNGGEFLEKNKSALFAQIDSRNPKAGLDVEVASSVALALCVNEDFFIPIKNYVYNRAEIETEGGTKIDMTLQTACYILSMPLRDLYLKEHPEIPTEN